MNNEMVIDVPEKNEEYHFASNAVSYIINRPEAPKVCELYLNIENQGSLNINCSELTGSLDKYTPKTEYNGIYLMFAYASVYGYKRMIDNYIVIYLTNGAVMKISDDPEWIKAMSAWWESN